MFSCYSILGQLASRKKQAKLDSEQFESKEACKQFKDDVEAGTMAAVFAGASLKLWLPEKLSHTRGYNFVKLRSWQVPKDSLPTFTKKDE